ncbi:alanine dehydrogenase [Crenobacter intestini]|uniref:Alanine dehydrogenase n=1 Tax=Crenobacter intestini TaxID=2563443 RepID=A0A4T0UW62_9NEIS|nr:alanine dehydrogenase [Crenobacter intestini]TIC83097.1 alanine dehydrogenase [Crenobacter intestini]
MLIGVPKEIKVHEYRVGLTPSGVRELVAAGHSVLVQSQAGLGVGFTDEHYLQAGASIAANAAEVFERAQMICKVKEPQPVECRMLRPGQVLFTYLHLAPDPDQTRLLVDSGAIAIAYETVTDDKGGLPLLAPMSEVAGRMAIQAGAHALEKAQGGRGVLLGGVPGVSPARVVVLGGGVVGLNAARMAMGVGADVTILDKSLPRLKEIDMLFEGRIKTLMSNTANIEEMVRDADMVIGAVLIPGAAAPKLVTRKMLGRMKPGAVLVDVAIDQGGCFETSRPTTHQEPTYVVDGIVHYCVANMPGGVARTSTMALTNATLPFALELANKGWARALLENPHLMNGLNVCAGKVTYAAVASALGYPYADPVATVKAAA